MTTQRSINDYSNVTYGNLVLTNNIDGFNNHGFGTNVLINNLSGSNNIAMGFNSMTTNSTGSYNTAIGNYSLENTTIGTSLTAIGHRAGNSVTTGIKNIFLGSNSDINTTSFTTLSGASSNNLVIGSDTDRMSTLSIGPYLMLLGPSKTLTNNTLTDLVSIALPSSGNTTAIYVQVFVSITGSNGISSGIYETFFSAGNDSGSLLTDVTGGTLSRILTLLRTLSVSFSSASSGTNALLRLNVNTSISSPTITAKVLSINGSVGDVQVIYQ